MPTKLLLVPLLITLAIPAFANPFVIKEIDIDSKIEKLHNQFLEMGGECKFDAGKTPHGQASLECQMTTCKDNSHTEYRHSKYGTLEVCEAYSDDSPLTIAGQIIVSVEAYRKKFATGVHLIRLHYADNASRLKIVEAFDKSFGEHGTMRVDSIRGTLEIEVWKRGGYRLLAGKWPSDYIEISADRESLDPALDDI